MRRLSITYENDSGNRLLEVDQLNLPATESDTPRLSSTDALDGSGQIRFVLTPERDLWIQELEITARWRPDGAGRGDATVTEGLGTGARGTDCWDNTARATYVFRSWDEASIRGTPQTCVFDISEP